MPDDGNAIVADAIVQRFQHERHPSDMLTCDRESISWSFQRIARHMAEFLPDCRERSIMFTKLEESQQWAEKAAARK